MALELRQRRCKITGPLFDGREVTGLIVGRASDIPLPKGLRDPVDPDFLDAYHHPKAVVVKLDSRPDIKGIGGLGELKDSGYFITNMFMNYTDVDKGLLVHSDVLETHDSIPLPFPYAKVIVTENFSQDGVTFLQGQTGFIHSVPGYEGEEKGLGGISTLPSPSLLPRNPVLTVMWDHRDPHFWSEKGQGSQRRLFHVHTRNLSFYALDGAWPSLEGLKKLGVGDFVRILSKNRLICNDTSGNEKRVPNGAIGKIIKGDGNHYVVEIVSDAEPEFLGIKVLGVREDFLRGISEPENFLPRGQCVEVMAEISFKNLNLKGKTAKVLLPTDGDGDVGLEFFEDISAGSLDGVGREGHCLYVRSGAIRKVK